MSREDQPSDSPGRDSTPWPLKRSEYTIRSRATFPSTKPALIRAVGHALKIARECGCVDDRTDLEIALREALANAMIHGNGFHRSKRIFLRCYGAPGCSLLILVRDEGDGFDPETVPDPRGADRMHLHHGRGLLLMRELMDYVEFRKSGREVLLYKAC